MACSKPCRSTVEEEKNCKLTYFFRDLLRNQISFQIPRDEIKDIVYAVETLVADIVRRVTDNVKWLGPYEKLRVLKVGSMAERTSIIYPDEFDFLIVTHQEGVEVERVCEGRKGYAHVKVTDRRLHSLWKAFLRGDYLQGSFSHDYFGKLTELPGYFVSVGRKWLRRDPLQTQSSCSLLDPSKDSLANAFMSEVAMVIKYAGDLRCCRNSGTLRVNKDVINHGPAFMPTFTWESKDGKKSRAITVDMTLAIEVNMSRHGNIIAENETFHSKVWRSLRNQGNFMLIPCKESASCASGLCFRLTFTETELELVRRLSVHHKECFKILKYIFTSGEGYSYLPSYAFKILVIKHNFFCRETANLAVCFKTILASLLYEIFKKNWKEQIGLSRLVGRTGSRFLSRLVTLFIPGEIFGINISSIFIKSHNILGGKGCKFTFYMFVSSIERMLESLEELDISKLNIVINHKTAAQAYTELMVPFMNKEFILCHYCLDNYFRSYGRRW